MLLETCQTSVTENSRLHCLDVPVVDDEVCKKAYPDMITRRMMCAGFTDGGRDACSVSVHVSVTGCVSGVSLRVGLDSLNKRTLYVIIVLYTCMYFIHATSCDTHAS